jgi:hypothetical protein
MTDASAFIGSFGWLMANMWGAVRASVVFFLFFEKKKKPNLADTLICSSCRRLSLPRSPLFSSLLGSLFFYTSAKDTRCMHASVLGLLCRMSVYE